MDPVSKAHWYELRAQCLHQLMPKIISCMASCLLWLLAGLLYGQNGLNSLVLLFFALYLPVGIAHILFGCSKDDWNTWFAPSLFLLSPIFVLFMIIERICGVAWGRPLIPIIFTGYKVKKITCDNDGVPGYCLTLTTGQHIVFEQYRYDPLALHLKIQHKNGAWHYSSFVSRDLSRLLLDLDAALLLKA